MTDHKQAVEMYECAVNAEWDNYAQAREDMLFRAGEQWTDAAKASRDRDGRPVLTFNRTGQFVRQITGDARQNPPSISVRPVDDDDQEYAELREGLIRHIEHRSKSSIAYMTALDGAATCGIGHIRVLTEWSEADPLNQEARIAPVRDPLSVHYDPDAAELTKHDGLFAFVTSTMSKRKFEAKYPKAKTADFPVRDEKDLWNQRDGIRVCEFFDRRGTTTRQLILSDGTAMPAPDDRALFAEWLAQSGLEVAREREVEAFRVYRRLMTGAEYLGDEEEFPSQWIPLIPVMGEEIALGGTTYRSGVLRFMKDAQRLYNYWRTSSAEFIAQAPRAPFLATAAQIGEYKPMWDTAHLSPRPYLLYAPDPDAATAMPTRATMPEPPAAMWQEASIATDDMKSITGIYDASLGAGGNETSGRAITARQREGDTGTFVYMDNLRHAVERVGVTLLDMIPRIYDSQRIVRIVAEDGTVKSKQINRPMMTGEVENDITRGAYDVRVSTGPTYTTKRVETAELMMQLVQALPAIGQIGGDILVENLDFANAEKLADRLRTFLPPNIKAAEGIEDQTPPQQPDPAMMAAVEKDAAQAELYKASAAKANAEAQSVALETLALQTGAIY